LQRSETQATTLTIWSASMELAGASTSRRRYGFYEELAPDQTWDAGRTPRPIVPAKRTILPGVDGRLVGGRSGRRVDQVLSCLPVWCPQLTK
jgi:hypothetical protein